MAHIAGNIALFAQAPSGSFRPPFSKGGAVEGAEPSSPSAEGEMLSAFLFDNFFFAPHTCKEKVGGESDVAMRRA